LCEDGFGIVSTPEAFFTADIAMHRVIGYVLQRFDSGVAEGAIRPGLHRKQMQWQELP
jgi:hypothetical protein